MHPIVSWLSQRFIRTGGPKSQKPRGPKSQNLRDPRTQKTGCPWRGGRAPVSARPAWAQRSRQALAAEELVDVVDCPWAWMLGRRTLTHFTLAAWNLAFFSTLRGNLPDLFGSGIAA